MIAYEKYKWLAISYRGSHLDDANFVAIIALLLENNIPTVIYNGPYGPIVVTWQRQAHA